MVGAIDRYMQVARCYRDETAKPDRQPEFTQLDIELSFTTKEGVQQLIEELLAYSWPSDISPLPSSPFPRLTYNEAMQRYGVDKPDTRFGMEIQDVSDSFSTCSAPGVIKALEGHQCSKVKAINFKHAGKQLSRKNVEELKQLIKDLHLSHVWHAFIKIDEDGGWQGSLDASLDEQHVHNINQQLSLQAGDLMILAAGSETEALPLLGRMRLQVANMLEDKGEDVREKDKMAFLWVVDFPMFLPKEDNSDGIESTHHPFTAPHPEDMSLVFSDPENARSQHYDLVLNGTEIGGGSIRMHNAKLQRYVLNNLLKEDTSSLEHLLTGLEYGCPPHGGIALGLDRLMSILCNASSVRDVIAFPKSGDGKDLMAKAPAQLSDADRQYYHLKGKQHQQ